MVPVAPVINARSEVVCGSMGIRSLTAETVFYLVAALQSAERGVREGDLQYHLLASWQDTSDG
jgi:hypothetical protein